MEKLFVLDGNNKKVPLPPSGGGSGAQRGQLQSLSSSLTAVNAKATEALAEAKIERLTITFAAIDAAGSFYVPAPFAGRLTGLAAMSTGTPNANLDFTASIGAQILVDGVATIASAAVPGTAALETVSGDNVVVEGGPVLIAFTTTNTATGTATVVVTFTKT